MAGLRQRRRRARERRIAEKQRLREREKLETLRRLQTPREPEPERARPNVQNIPRSTQTPSADDARIAALYALLREIRLS